MGAIVRGQLLEPAVAPSTPGANRWVALARRPCAAACLALVCGAVVGGASHQELGGAAAVLLFLGVLAWLVLDAAMHSPRWSMVWLALGVAAMHGCSTFWMGLVIPDSVTNANAWRVVLMVGVAALEASWSVLAWALALWAARSGGARRLPVRLGLAWALAWWASDIARGSGWWADAYGSLSIALVSAPGVDGWLPWVGAHGVAALAAGVCALPFVAWHERRGSGPEGAGARVRWAAALVAALLPVAVLASAGGWLHERSAAWTTAQPRSLSVTALQASRDKRAPWTTQVRDSEMAKLLRAIALAPQGGLVIAPETYFDDAVPPPDAPDWETLPRQTREHRVHALVGIPLLGRDADGRQMMNAVVHVAPERRALYAKERLVPGAEYIPWPSLLQPLLAELFDMRLKSQLPAPPELRQSMYVDGHLLGISICHELSFPDTMAARGRDSHMLVNVADDNWIPSPAYREMMQRIARLRAIEAGKPLVRVSNGMPALWVDEAGRVLQPPTRRTDAGVTSEVVPRHGATPYHLTAWLQTLMPLCLLSLWAGAGVWQRVFGQAADTAGQRARQGNS